MAESFAVLVLDMSRTDEEDDSRVIDGFASFEAARDYAEARTRASVEELRKPGQSEEELRTLWHIYGEDCLVLGGGYSGREVPGLLHHLAGQAVGDRLGSAGAGPSGPQRLGMSDKRFYATLLFSNAAGASVWAGGFFSRAAKPKRAELFELFKADAAAAFARRGDADPVPVEVHVANLFEMPEPPRPAADDRRPLKRWRVAIDFVCHDVKFGSDSSGVFEWPEEPQGAGIYATRSGNRLGPHRRIGEVDARVAGDERQRVLRHQPGEQALAFEAVDLPVEQLETGEPELPRFP